jgi:hypothetical protein
VQSALGGLFVELFADDGPMQRQLKAVQGKLRSWGSSIQAVGAKVLGAGLALDALGDASVFAFASMAGEMGKASLRTGIAVEQLSGLKFAAEAGGGSVEGLEHALQHMSTELTSAMQGSAEANRAFAMLHLSARQLVDLSPDQAFRQIADAVARVRNPMEQSARAQAIFGRGVVEMLPLLRKGAAGIDQFQKQAQSLGLVTSAQDVQTAREFNVLMMELTGSLKRVAYEVGRALLPAMRDLRGQILPYVTDTIKWVRENQGLVASAGKLGLTIAGLGAGITAFGIGLKVAGAGVGILRTGLSLLLSPAGLATAGILGLGYALSRTETGGKVLEYLGQRFGDLKTTAIAAWKGIYSALQAGDLGAAAAVAWAGLKLAFVQGSADLQVAWAVMTDYLRQQWDATVLNITDTWANAATFFGTITDAIFGPFNSALDQADDKTESLVNTWENWERAIRSTIDQLARLPGFEAVLPVKGAMDFLDNTAAGVQGRGPSGAAGNAKRDELNAEIARLQQEMRDALEEAGGLGSVARFNAGRGEAGAPAPGGGFFGTGKVSTAGSFGGELLGQMGGGTSAADRTAKATEKALEKLDKLTDAVQAGALAGMTF